MKPRTHYINIAVPSESDEPNYEPVEAIVFGAWAAHPQWLSHLRREPDRWTVTHVYSGLALPTLTISDFDEVAAINLAAYLELAGVKGPTSEVVAQRDKIGQVLHDLNLILPDQRVVPLPQP